MRPPSPPPSFAPISWPGLLVLLGLALGLPRPAQAQEDREESFEDAPPPPIAGPTSGDASFLSGRTLGGGEVMIAGGAGWPSAWAQLTLAPSSTFNLGVRASFDYGSPLMGGALGFGGGVAVPMRIHLWGEAPLDLALLISPSVTLAQGVLLGETVVFADDLGLAARVEVGALLGYQPAERITLLGGLSAEVGFVTIFDGGEAQPVGGLLLTFGVEGLLARDLMLFGLASAGYGFAPEGSGRTIFPDRYLVRVAFGVAYLL